MNVFSFKKGSDRNTQCHVVEVHGVVLFISYETVVAARYLDQRMRRGDEWGPTTRRHMREMGVYDWPIVEERQIEDFITRALFSAAMSIARERLGAPPSTTLERMPDAQPTQPANAYPQ